jgi:arsenite/tail-anchored protein-transporting ATPase
VRHLFNRRIVFFGGKGGVGKTTCSAAMALAASRQGRRVLLVSTDPAHSISDIFERPLDAVEREIAPGLHGIEIDAEFEARRYLDEIKTHTARAFSPSVLKVALRQIELAASMPGVADVAMFDRLADLILARARDYDLLVIDTAPTGHTLRLLQMPEQMGVWVQALSRRRRALLEFNQETGSLGSAMPAPSDDPVLATLERRAQKLTAVRTELMRADTTALVFVLIAERLPIEESARAVPVIQAAGLHVAGIVVNRVLPESLPGDFYLARRRQERVYLDEIDRRFAGFPRVRVPQFASDVFGIDTLTKLSEILTGSAR